MTRLDERARELLLSWLAEHPSPAALARHMERSGYGSRTRCQALIHQALREEAEAAAETAQK